jgi:hypothetical protein
MHFAKGPYQSMVWLSFSELFGVMFLFSRSATGIPLDVDLICDLNDILFLILVWRRCDRRFIFWLT